MRGPQSGEFSPSLANPWVNRAFTRVDMVARAPKLAICALATALAVPVVIAGALAAGAFAVLTSAAHGIRPVAGRVGAFGPRWQRKPAVGDHVVPV